MRKGEELKVPYHASAAAARDNYVPYSRQLHIKTVLRTLF